jgi:hypothetical protein
MNSGVLIHVTDLPESVDAGDANSIVANNV